MMPDVLDAAFRSLILAFAVAAGLRAFRVRNVIAQKAAWGLVLAAALLMPLLAPRLARWLPAYASVTLPLRPMAQPAQIEPVPQAAPPQKLSAGVAAAVLPRQARAHAIHVARSTKPGPIPEGVIADSAAPAAAETGVYTGTVVAAVSATPAPRRLFIAPSMLAWMLYLAVAAALLLRLFFGLASALHLLFAAEALPAHDGAHLAGGLSVCVSRTVSSPVTIGSRVVLPADYTAWDAEKLRVVLAHERSHIRQGDFYLQFLAGLYAALVWFSPLGWWLKRELSDLAETISDRAGLEQAASTTAYAQILLEFAAAPRTANLGVAMARTGSLSRRIERLLNDNAFRQAFAGGRRRALVAVLLVPAALFGVTALVRVQAAQEVKPLPAVKPEIAPQPAPAAKPSPAHVVDAEPAEDAAPRAVVVPPMPRIVPVPSIPSISVVIPRIQAMPAIRIPKIPAIPQLSVVAPPVPVGPSSGIVVVTPQEFRLYAMAQENGVTAARRGYRSRSMIDGDSYAIIRRDGGANMTFSGEMHTGDIDKARKLAHGDFLWFERGDKQYFVDDPATLAQIEAMYKPIDELGKQQEALGRQQEELGRQQEALGKQQEQASLPAPDMQKEMAEIDAAMARLKAKMGQNVTQDELGDLQNRLGDLQGKLGDLQGKIGEKQGELGAQQGRLGAQQGKLGAEQGRLGAEQGRLSMEADRKVRSIIDESLTNGKAHAIQ
jgi:hypothetical protein